MPLAFVRVYLPAWASACLFAIGLAAQRPAAFTILRRDYWRWLLRPWKLVTFAAALAIMVGIAPYSGDPTWDRVDGGAQSVLTFTTAPWAVGVLYRALRGIGPARQPREIYGAACAWLFSASWFYDGWLLYRDHVYPTGWALNLGASSALYVLGGVLWNVSARQGERVGLAFTDPAWPRVDDGGFRRVAWLALAVMVAAVVLLAPFAWMACDDLRARSAAEHRRPP
jgi:hypothetical protein